MADPAQIRCVVLDVDGTLTDGRLHVNPANGSEWRAFDVHDGLAIRLFQQAGGEVVICSGKGGGSIEQRAALLEIRHVIQRSTDKLGDLQGVLAALGVTLEQTAMMGDDLPDVNLMRHCGYAIAPANARPEVLANADLITNAPGGRGAVREALEFLMQQAGTWLDVLRRYNAIDSARRADA